MQFVAWVKEIKPTAQNVLIVFDAQRDLDPCCQRLNVQWVVNQLVQEFWFDEYDIIPTLAYWPLNSMPLNPCKRTTKRLSAQLIDQSCLCILTGGNGMCLLDAFSRNEPARLRFASAVQANEIALATWSAGTTCAGMTAAHSADKSRTMVLRDLQSLRPEASALTGLELIPNYSFAPHFEYGQQNWWRRFFKRRPVNNFLNWIFMKDDCWIAFAGGDIVYTTSLDYGRPIGV